jgi:hypothetical protein
VLFVLVLVVADFVGPVLVEYHITKIDSWIIYITKIVSWEIYCTIASPLFYIGAYFD